jgi:hypothetical protein
VIYLMALEVVEAMRVRGYPVRLVYGPELLGRETFEHVIVVERDREASDGWAMRAAAPAGRRKRGVRVLKCKATIYAASAKDGAHVGDHEDEGERVVDGFLTALSDWGVAGRTGGIEYVEGKPIAASEYGPHYAQWAGFGYVVKFNVPRGVFALTYTGANRPTGAIGSVSSTTQVRYATTDGDPEIGCGS